MQGNSGAVNSHVGYTYKQPLNDYYTNRQSAMPHFPKEPIDHLLSELQSHTGSLSTVRTAVGVGKGVTVKKKELSRYVDSFSNLVKQVVVLLLS